MTFFNQFTFFKFVRVPAEFTFDPAVELAVVEEEDDHFLLFVDVVFSVTASDEDFCEVLEVYVAASVAHDFDKAVVFDD